LGGTGSQYFENAARIVLRRYGIDLVGFDWERDPRAAGMLGRMLTLAANMFAYVPGILYSSKFISDLPSFV